MSRRMVAIGGFVADSDGSDFRATQSLAGWEDSAPVRSEMEDRVGQDGAFDSVGYFGPRVISHEGVVEQASRADALAVLDQLMSLSPRMVHEFVVDDPNIGVRSAFVRVLGTSVEWASPVRFRYTVQLKAPDPTKYGAPVFTSTTLGSAAGGTGRTWPRVWPTDYGTPPGVVPGGVFLPNAGSTSYHPRVRIGGGVTNPRLVMAETGDVISVRYVIPDGQWVDFNAGKPREVLLNGQVSLRHLTTISGNALAVPVGGGSLTVTADSYTAAHSVSVWGFERADQ